MSETAVVWRHALPNALVPIVTVIGLQFGALLTGAIVTETVPMLLVDARNGKPIRNECVNVWTGTERDRHLIAVELILFVRSATFLENMRR